MTMNAADVMKLIEEKGIKFVDYRFTDTRGKEQHVTVPISAVDEDVFEDGKMFDGSSIAGWKGIQESDMILMPDPVTAFVDPFFEEPTLILTCDVIEPNTMQGYERDPRSLARRAEAYLKSTGIADTAYFGPENEFFIFDDIRWGADISGCFYKIDSSEAGWNSERAYEGGNFGHRPGIKGGYFPVPPVDSLHDIRAAMCLALEQAGLRVEVHHHEVATAGQCEIGVGFDTLVRKADEVQVLKYVVQNVAQSYGKTATFMPKPLVGDNGSGMHVHQSLAKGGVNLFAGDQYAGLSEIALYYIGGIIKHAKALNAFTNASTNSYKRLVPHFEAPVMLAYSARNRSASIRIPVCQQPEGPPHRGAVPRFDRQSVSGLRGDDDGRSGRHPEQDPSGRSDGQGSLRPAGGRGKADSQGLFLLRRSAGRAGRRPRVPHQGRRVHQRSDRRLHQPEERGSDPAAHDHAPGRVRSVLQPVRVAARRFSGRAPLGFVCDDAPVWGRFC